LRIAVQNLSKSFGGRPVLNDINLDIQSGEFLGLLGPSGSGKTSLLRILAGLDFPEQGTVLLDNKNLLTLPLKEREVGFVFQHYALFNHMTVSDNVSFGLRMRSGRGRRAPKEIANRVEELLSLVQLQGLGDRYPVQLSGGQRQRVALARTLAIEPKALLLDEPFGALDAKVRIELRRWLRELHDAMQLTTIFVTHDQEEALDLADRVAIMNKGSIEQVGTPLEIYGNPHSAFVYDFLGRANMFDCEMRGGTVRLGDKDIPRDEVPDGPCVAFVRPHDVLLDPKNAQPSQDATLAGPATVRFLSLVGPRATVELSHNRRLIEAELTHERVKQLDLKVGSQCVVRLRSPRVFARSKVAEIQTEAKRARRTQLRFLRRRKKDAEV
jgi:sulfate transport system ATP-binding protein